MSSFRGLPPGFTPDDVLGPLEALIGKGRTSAETAALWRAALIAKGMTEAQAKEAMGTVDAIMEEEGHKSAARAAAEWN